MARQTMLKIGKSSIVDDDEDFTEGFFNGCLYHYDTNSEQPYPLTSQSIITFLKECLLDKRHNEKWNSGFVLGWITALNENNPKYFFTSILPETSPASDSLSK
ncbi:hypothetical protein EPA93_42005 [Ktedonosporobacter rubrisoli]|uniref:Uncharacterized protein n=1 Tax=Ktedonosporobacter rubrisoli TaxID=2509675 RepID=A0A4P6K1Z2_KTERU|nr:hypothetical protein [Ktedonosporobacter rubrisoli]QBD82207.1 hypothetical protein EPA93_42005 [Ktedonosporobacter rubrisoli]